MLVASVEVNNTLACGVQPLDLVTHCDSMPVEILSDFFGRCNLFDTMTQTVADVWIARTSLVLSI